MDTEAGKMNELNISKTLVTKRKEKGVTQEELAKYLGVTKASVSKWETGQSYPDIVLLPQLAAYFNITVDELIGYEPQMTREDVKRLYINLCKAFAEQPFEDVLATVQETVKKYYSCFRLLHYMGMLLINHYALAKAETHAEVIGLARDLFIRVRVNSEDFRLCKQANAMEACCCLLLGDAMGAIEALGDCDSPSINEKTFLSAAYLMRGQQELADETLQVGAYQNLIGLMENLTGLLPLQVNTPDAFDRLTHRIAALANAFEMDALHPGVMLSAHLSMAQCYAVQNNPSQALVSLKNYCNLAMGGQGMFHLHGDAFFDKITKWVSELDLGANAPRDERTIRQSLLAAVEKNPAFVMLSEESQYKTMLQLLSGRAEEEK